MTSNDLTETFLTVADVAGLLQLNQQTVRNWIDQGKLPAVRVGRRVRIRRADLDRIIEDSSRSGENTTVTIGPSADDFWGGEQVGAVDISNAPKQG